MFAVLVAVSVSLWTERQYVTELFAKSYETDKGKKKKKRKKSVPVIVKYVDQAADVVQIEAIGTARAKQFVTIYSQAAGEIIDFKVSAGDKVKKGQAILTLESRKARLAKRLAEKRLSEAKRLLARSRPRRDPLLLSTAVSPPVSLPRLL